jgi:replicative DNA helicase
MHNLNTPPNDKEIEKNILGVLLISSNVIPDVVNKISVDFFYDLHHQIIYRSIVHLYDNRVSVDYITIVNHLKQTNQLEIVGGAYEIVKLTNDVISSAHLHDWVSILQHYYLQRQGIEIGQSLINHSYTTTEIQSVLNSASSEILNAQQKVFKSTELNMNYYLMELNRERCNAKENGQIGINTGWQSLNDSISGWVNPDLVILAARPAQGKTAFMLNTILNVLQQNLAVGVFSLEMSGTQLVNRLLSLVSKIPHHNLRHNTLSDLQNNMLGRAENKMLDFPLYIDDSPNMNIRDLRSKATIMKRKYDIKLLCIDYLQLMSGVDKKANRESEIAEISRGCKIIAKELDIPVIALSQLSRAVESRPDKMPQLSDLRESGSIEQDADSVIFLMRPETYNIREVEISGDTISSDGLCIVKVAKNRHGSLRNIPFRFLGERMEFSEYDNVPF